MKEDFVDALKALNADKGIPADYMLEKIKKAMIIVCRNNYGNDDVRVDLKSDNSFCIKLNKKVVEEVQDENCEISISEAKKYKEDAEINDKISIELEPKDFGRIAAQTARNIIRQNIRDSEKERIISDLKCNEGQIISAKVLRINPESKSIILQLAGMEVLVPRSALIESKNFDIIEGEYIKVYVVSVNTTNFEPVINVSRACDEFIQKLFELEVPELMDGTIEIKCMSREAGSRTKIAVASNDINVDPLGTCIGERGTRIKKVLKELGGEKIDIVEYSITPEEFIKSSLAPAEISNVEICNDPNSPKKMCKVFVSKQQLSLAIGAKGQNVRLAAKLTGYKIELFSID
ncbi:MAG: transcription termination/antitermination protein NusA [Candidatus Improbicoccus pseudotrichonymphae]|uniref:Transcription termination/antitermination protein NusA n=1 Tax=Candidatus Improbicoccus pseudotrichonymphae TaxID=3033792 RepID=A0AA48I809_9FIRM|nr:MAG: transcription termination/antitermination protein NusA [Candidatus Improbicoccus pseudotrichonymphae]